MNQASLMSLLICASLIVLAIAIPPLFIILCGAFLLYALHLCFSPLPPARPQAHGDQDAINADWAAHFEPVKRERAESYVCWYMSRTDIRIANPHIKEAVRAYLMGVAMNGGTESEPAHLDKKVVGQVVQEILNNGKKR